MSKYKIVKPDPDYDLTFLAIPNNNFSYSEWFVTYKEAKEWLSSFENGKIYRQTHEVVEEE